MTIQKTIERLTELFLFRCKDKRTLSSLHAMAAHPSHWKDGSRLFRDIRKKTLATDCGGNGVLLKQYLFEECCAKVLYNLSGEPAPFRASVADWLIPNALALARVLGIAEVAVTGVIATERQPVPKMLENERR